MRKSFSIVALLFATRLMPNAHADTNRGTMNLKAKFVFSIGLLGLLCLMLPGSLRAQTVTGTPYMSNINPADPSYSGYWATPLTTITSTPTGLEFNAPGGSGSFSTMFYAIPSAQQTPLNPLDTQVTFKFTWNLGNALAGVNVLFALDDNMGGVDYYGTGYNVPSPGLNSYTFALQAPNQAHVAAGALINGLNFQIDPTNVSGNYDITYSSLTLSQVPAPSPEPASILLFGTGLLGVVLLVRNNLLV
jgi:PEP-CTERM motif